MSEPFIGEIRIFGFNWAPRGWALCSGQMMQVSQNTSLFSLIGCTYGGDCRTTFALPDLRGRAPLGYGRGSGLSNRPLAQKAGAETTTLAVNNMPSHTHALRGTTTEADTQVPTGASLADPRSNAYKQEAPNTYFIDGSVGAAGSGDAANNMQPYLAVSFCIALVGLYPSRP